MNKLRILFASDLHGSEIVFEKLIDATINWQANALIIGGDISGKTMIPIIKGTSDIYQASFLGKNLSLKSQQDLIRLEKDISNSGSYPIYLEPVEFEAMRENANLKNDRFILEMKLRLARWINYAKTKLNDHNIRFILMCGNDDKFELDDVITSSDYAENPEYKILTLGGEHEVVGESGANLTPFNCPRDIDEETLLGRIEAKMKNIQDPSNAILVLHAPPFNSQLDTAIKLNKDLKPIMVGGNVLEEPVGSKAVRKIIEDYQPLLSLHGHIHEKYGFKSIGRTKCVNPGSEYNRGIMNGYFITIINNEVRGHQRLSY